MRVVLNVLAAAAIALAACGGAGDSGASNATATAKGHDRRAHGDRRHRGGDRIVDSREGIGQQRDRRAASGGVRGGGVPNASRWVIEVQEYRPYPVDDPTFAKLKSNLAKYNPSADTLSRILAALSLP
jgi:Ni/Co efflux regulator RcnB